MDSNKNSYTFGFAAIMVIVVAVILSGTSIILKDAQYTNVELEKKQSILRSVGVYVNRDQAAIDYPIYIKEELVLNHLGEIINNLSAFDVDLSKEVKKSIVEDDENIPLEERTSLLPIYISEVEGATKYIIPLRGKGLWGPIWGFISFNDDFNTVFAAVFDHKAETPGLGAEINTALFQDVFEGKTIFEEDSNKFVSILVQKGGSNGDIHKVDGISGGTITSVGVEKMIKERLKRYLPYFRLMEDNGENKRKKEVRLVMEVINTDEKRDSISNIGKRVID
ncbi:MAG: NADH:ubiquinone reductase (Na(+)-transporting) subunit C [Flavobacteriales bacterium]|nr:NADH:ubiquinone reductase (Na(+)-transporting) subunit C [Flavobacteriales bacterium]|tara:strand:+ start:532 stop:1371 length:840 start_codon:yes stop_codon:yes gene_type:complete